MAFWWNGPPSFDEEEEPRAEWRFRTYDQADEWGKKHYRQEAPEPPELPEGTRFHNYNQADPFASASYPPPPAPSTPTRERADGVFWDEYDTNVVWEEKQRSVTFVEPDTDELNALMAPDPEPPPKHWSDWKWTGGPGRYEAFRWPEDGKEPEGLRYLEDAKAEARYEQIAREVGATFVQPQVDPRAVRQQELEQRLGAPWPVVEPQVIDVAVTESQARDGTVAGEIALIHYGHTPEQYGQTDVWLPMPAARDWPAELAQPEIAEEQTTGLWFPYVAPNYEAEDVGEQDDTEAEERPEKQDNGGGGDGLIWR
jgi:hypothetical protein